jgi:hypothetical protein
MSRERNGSKANSWEYIVEGCEARAFSKVDEDC